ncbi:hypothetical protein HMPREF1531_01802 [Propionibacterium sp. oral taxon 192 str. F0372]|uniref:hypothetical protein n=1 Tax=Propionibacterium sp. oral taxon 192 TaxID=671222 RepID=UPI0003539F90|nr:hypothetical protein HMPREF1531_01802 [Propionibacterium sp. oral taxon 192 str. F0372]
MTTTRGSGTTSRGPTVVGCAVVGLIAVVLCSIIATIVTQLAHRSEELAPVLPDEGCMVSLDSGFTTTLTWEQAHNAAIIVGESIRRGLPARAATIALVTAYQESGLRNLDHGDRDSVGLFQQRPSQGWGTVEQIMDPWYSSGAFYTELVKIDGWESGVINDVAQTVQRSGFPQAYAQHEDKGRAWASALNGYDPATVTCFDTTAPGASVTVLTNFFEAIWDDAVTSEVDATGSLRVTTPDETKAWAVAQLSMLLGRQAGMTGVAVGNQTWTRSDTEYAIWQAAAQPSASSVVINLRP